MAVPIKQRLDEFTPIICRLLARKTTGRRVDGLHDEEIAEASNLQLWMVKSVSWLPTWDHTESRVMLAFIEGCGIKLDDWKDMQIHSTYLAKKPAWKYLRRYPDEWYARWHPMIIIQKKYYNSASYMKGVFDNEITKP
jgi:hypothetical protein